MDSAGGSTRLVHRGKEASSIAKSSFSLNRVPAQSVRRAPGARRVCAAMIFIAVIASAARGEVFLPRPDGNPAIAISAKSATKWQEGVYETWHLTGDCTFRQGDNIVTANEAIVWIAPPSPDEPDAPHKVIIYAEPATGQSVQLAHRPTGAAASQQNTPTWFGRWTSGPGVAWTLAQQSVAPPTAPAIHTRATAALQSAATAKVDGEVQPAQFQQFVPPPAPSGVNQVGVRRIRLAPRSGVGMQFEGRALPNGESIGIISGGAQIIIEGLNAQGIPAEIGSVDMLDIQTDRAVVWTAGGINGGSFEQGKDVPMEIYMEGNIVFRQGDRTVYADRMYYDVRRNVGTIINAELQTPLTSVKGVDYAGIVRLRAGVIEQLDASRFVAHDAMLTPSRLEVPSSHLGARTITLENTQRPKINPLTGQQAVNPVTLEPEFESRSLAQSQGNFVYIDSWPVFYWPTLTTDLEEPNFYINNLRVRNDRIYGFQALVGLDMFQMLGVNEPPRGVEWELNLDYLNKRGFGYGTTVEYNRDEFFGILGPVDGLFDTWFIKDHGVDNLGFFRRDIVPEKSFRGRTFLNHRQYLTDGWLEGWTVQGEIGWISDRTFLEQYYEQEYDDRKDQLTGIRLKRVDHISSFGIEANGQLNPFWTQTQWLPRLDYYRLGQDFGDEVFTWNSHTSGAYANQNMASTPTNPTLLSQFTLFPWETDSLGNRATAEGERILTRNSIAAPINLEPFKVVPYVLGELGHWGQDLEGNDIQRAYGQVGLKASIPFWTVNPYIQDPVFNLNGLAHKVVFDMDASYSESNRDMTDFPLYDEIDDDVFDDIRRRLFFQPFGGLLAGTYFDPSTTPTTIDPKFDPRFYLLRSNTQGWVTSPGKEIADDLSVVRFGMRQRLQTKRGLGERQHIVDWMTLDSNISWFPQDGRDNFGSDFGLFDYDYSWHLGDRFTLVSDGAADMFGDGLRTVSGGMILNRPSRGNIYMGYRTMRGPFTADVLTATVNYRMNTKWVGSASAMYDFSEAGNIGQSLTFSRIGESLIVSIGGSYDESKDNVSFNFMIEPRFLPKLMLQRETGIIIPPVGVGGPE
ncbi:hypothetical protein [Aeoliella sp. SH292]|uniref:hypothetical protein n=1 Tax=Aeoliella sp. SH292 TaxID=3454464 RepID=UPI003F9B57AA